MKRIQEIKEARKQRFFQKRMLVSKRTEKETIRADIEKNIELVAPSSVLARARELGQVSEKLQKVIKAKAKAKRAKQDAKRAAQGGERAAMDTSA